MGGILYTRLRILMRIMYLNLWVHPSARRIFFTVLLALVLCLHWGLLIVFRILDFLFFPSFKNISIQKPVFIISTPRSGTTYLHHLFSLDKENYVTPYLFHTIFPSASFFFLIQKISWIDQAIGSPLEKGINRLNRIFFSGWQDIHPMGLNQPEEDEGLFTIAMATPAVILFSPYILMDQQKWDLDFCDETDKKNIRAFYYSSLQRFMYIYGANKTLLIKNVFDCGRIAWLHEMFPDATFICPVRSPYQTIPSAISMFTSIWKWHSPDIPQINPYSKAFADILMHQQIHYFQYIQNKSEISFITLDYLKFLQNTVESIASIYQQMQRDLPDSYLQNLRMAVESGKQYKSKHHYSLEAYGINRNEVFEKLRSIFETFHFPKES